MAEVALVAGLAQGASSIFGGLSKSKEGKEADAIARVNARNLIEEGDSLWNISRYNADITRRSGEFEGAQLERAAGEERAASQVAAREKRMELDRALSTQRARAASGGAGGIGTTGVLDIMGDTIERGEYLAGHELFGGETRARGRLDQAASARAKALAAAYGIELEGDAARKKAAHAAEVARMQGAAAKKAGKNAMWGSILEGGGKALTAGAGYFGGGTGGYDPRWGNTTVTKFR